MRVVVGCIDTFALEEKTVPELEWGTYLLEFNEQQWEEIGSLAFEGFDPEPGVPLSRPSWMAIAHMALGKAQRIEAGDYGDPEADEQDESEAWAKELRGVAQVVLDTFKPGDGKV